MADENVKPSTSGDEVTGSNKSKMDTDASKRPQKSSITPVVLFLFLITLGIVLSFVIDNQKDVQRFSFAIITALGVGLGATFLTGKITGGGKLGFLNLRSITGGFLLFLVTVVLFIIFFPIPVQRNSNSQIKTNFNALKINEPVSFWADNTSNSQLSFEWFINNKKTSTSNPFEMNFHEKGIYNVKLVTFESGDSIDTDQLIIQVNPLEKRDINIVLMDTFDPTKIYKDNSDPNSVATGETNSHVIKRILDNRFDTVTARPQMFIELTKQETWAFDRQTKEIRNYKPHLVIIHRSAFPPQDDKNKQDKKLIRFINSLQPMTKFFIYSRTLNPEIPNEFEYFTKKLADSVTNYNSRVTVFRFRNNNTFFDDENRGNLVDTLYNLIEKIKTEINSVSSNKR